MAQTKGPPPLNGEQAASSQRRPVQSKSNVRQPQHPNISLTEVQLEALARARRANTEAIELGRSGFCLGAVAQHYAARLRAVRS